MRVLAPTIPLLFLFSSASVASQCEANLTQLLPPASLPLTGPQGIAYDPEDGSCWITFALSTSVHHFNRDFREIGGFDAAFPPLPNHALPESITGIAIRTGGDGDDTLLVSRPAAQEIREYTKAGEGTGLVITLDLPRPPNAIPEPFIKGLEYNPGGNGGNGSIWVVEGVMTAFYEVDLAGNILRSFCHPNDPDGCPGKGAAAFARDVGLIWDGDEAVGLEIIGAVENQFRIHQLGFDGRLSGVSYPLDVVGGRPGGFSRGQFTESGGEPRDAFFVVVESSAELHVLDIGPPDLLPPLDLECRAESESVELRWRNTDSYDEIEVKRDGEVLATLAGDSEAYTDLAPPDGILDYEVVASANSCRLSATCMLLVGPGVILNSHCLDEDFFDPARAVDLTEDASGLLWVTVASPQNKIVIYDKDLQFIADLDSPFIADEEAETSGIAYNPASDSFFVYDATANLVAEIDAAGEVVENGLFESGLPPEDVEKSAVTAMLYNPQGNGGTGSFWYMDALTGRIEERNRSGDLLYLCMHPDQTAEPLPKDSGLRAYMWGMTEIPGTDFSLLELPGGTVRDGRTSRIFRLDVSTCARTAHEIPVEAIAEFAVPYSLGVHRSTHGVRDVMYVILSSSFGSCLFEIAADPPSVAHPADVSCRQPSASRNVEIKFLRPPDVDAVEILRDGDLIATLANGESSHTDKDVPDGFHSYRLRAVRDGQRSDDRTCALDVGPGSIARRGIVNPFNLIHQIVYDPGDQVYIAASKSPRSSDFLYVFNLDLGFVRKFPSPFLRPREIAAMALRRAEGRSEIFCLGWIPSSGIQTDFPLHVVDTNGDRLRELEVSPPRPRGGFVVFPAGLAWDPDRDTLWLLERNSATVAELSVEGETLASFPHPLPPPKDGLQNFGLAVNAATNTLFLSTAGLSDDRISKLVEVTRSGQLAGPEIPLDARFYSESFGFTLDPEGTGFVVSAMGRGVFDLVHYRAFDPARPVEDVQCARDAAGVNITWSNGEAYDTIEIHRNGESVAILPGTATDWTDGDASSCGVFYRIVGWTEAFQSPGVVCEPPPRNPFVRGDVDGDDKINITDAIDILGYLFLGGDEPPCLDASDANDDGKVNIADPINLLSFLFLGGPPPTPPFPSAGCDPTEDDLDCAA